MRSQTNSKTTHFIVRWLLEVYTLACGGLEMVACGLRGRHCAYGSTIIYGGTTASRGPYDDSKSRFSALLTCIIEWIANLASI